jgi:hypothetical protein
MLVLKAKCDGRKIVLPAAIRLPVGAVVVVFEGDEADDDRDLWRRLSAQGLAAAYGDHEPDYALKLVKESNAGYKPSRKATSS